MGKGKKAERAAKKTKTVTIEVLDRDDRREQGGKEPHAWRILDWLLENVATHSDVTDAKFAIAYQLGNIREDVDGSKGFGKVKRGSDLDRAFYDTDFVIIIPKQLWQASDSTSRHSIMDHLLCHCAVTKDQHGETKEDELGRTVYRTRKPLRMFPENVGRYGVAWQAEAMAKAIARYKDKNRPLLPDDRDAANEFSEPAFGDAHDPKPTKKVNGVNGHAGGPELPWRERPLEVLDLTPGLLAALQRANAKTLADCADNDDVLSTLGEKMRERLVTKLEAYRKEHPEPAGA